MSTRKRHLLLQLFSRIMVRKVLRVLYHYPFPFGKGCVCVDPVTKEFP